MFCELCNNTGNESLIIGSKGSHICLNCLTDFNDVVISSSDFLPLSPNSWNKFIEKAMQQIKEIPSDPN